MNQRVAGAEGAASTGTSKVKVVVGAPPAAAPVIRTGSPSRLPASVRVTS